MLLAILRTVLLFLALVALGRSDTSHTSAHDAAPVGRSISSSPPQSKRVVLVLGAANSHLNWTHVEAQQETVSSSASPWTTQEADLTGFGNLMKGSGSFQFALDRYSAKLTRAV